MFFHGTSVSLLQILDALQWQMAKKWICWISELKGYSKDYSSPSHQVKLTPLNVYLPFSVTLKIPITIY